MDDASVRALITSPVIFVVCAYFTRATWPRIGAALAGGAVFAALNVAVDVIAYHAGWWSYPDYASRGFGSPLWYIAAGIGTAGVALIGWRVHRRFGFGGLVVFLLAFATYGLLRDWAVSHTLAKDLIEFGDGATPWLVDYAAWFTLMAVSMATQSALRGNPSEEPLARSVAGS